MPGIKRKRGPSISGTQDAPIIEQHSDSTAGTPSKGQPDDGIDPDLKRSKVDLGKRRTLFVRSLGPTTTEKSLIEHFSNRYPLKHATLVLDSTTKKSKGFGFVTVADVQDAQAAVKELNGSVLDGKKIRIEIAEPRHREEGNRSAVALASAQSHETRNHKAEETKPPRLIVRNLPWNIKEPKDLEKLFLSYGKVKNVVIPKGKAGLQSGFGFVTIRGKKNAERAIEGVNGREVDGRTIAVDWAVEKEVYEREAGITPMQTNDSTTPKSGQSSIASIDEIPSAKQSSLKNTDDRDVSVDVEEFLANGDFEDEDDSNADDVDDEIAEDDADEDLDMEDSDLDIVTAEKEDDPITDQSRKVHYGDELTLFVRNLPYSSTDESLTAQFTPFGPVRYARVVMDPASQQPKGTGFVCFYDAAHHQTCLKQAPRPGIQATTNRKRVESVLQDERTDPTGRYTMDGRVLHVSQAVSKDEATKLATSGSSARMTRDRDRRRLYLLMEGTVSKKSPLYNQLAPSEVKMREASLAQRQKLIQSNPSLNLSLTRLSVRNIPRNIDSKALKALARDAVVGFAKDVKAGTRERISKEELSRDASTMMDAEKQRKARGKGVVKQAKVVFEGERGEKIKEDKETKVVGRSRGYGFVEFSSHRWALMGLRWLNGHAVGKTGAVKGEDPADRKRRLIVEFAIENAAVVKRRTEMEKKSGQRPRKERDREREAARQGPEEGEEGQGPRTHAGKRLYKRQKRDETQRAEPKKDDPVAAAATEKSAKEHTDLVRRQQIIARKRMKRRRGGK